MKTTQSTKLQLSMATKLIPVGYPLKPSSIWRVFPALIGFGYEFEFSRISKHGYGTGNGDKGTHLKLVSNVENQFIVLFIYSLRPKL